MNKGKTAFYLLFMAFLMAVMVWILVYANLHFPTIGQYAQVPGDIEYQAYAFSDLKLGDAGDYRLVLENTERKEDLALVLSAMRPFSVFVNGQLYYTYTANSLYTRIHTIALKDTGIRLEIKILTPSRQAYPKMILSTTERSGQMSHIALIVGCISVGIHLMMLFTCLTLYLQKKSEKYLLAQFVIAFISLCAAVLTMGIQELPITESTYVWIQRGVNSTLMPSGTAICILLAPGIRSQYIKPAIAGCIATVPITIIAGIRGLSGFSEGIAWLLFGVGALALTQALFAKMPHAKFLVFQYLLCQALRTYSQLNNWGYLSSTELLEYVYLPPVRSILLLFACMLVVNTRFAQTFQQVGDLVSQLNKTNATLDAKVAQRTEELVEQQELRRGMMVNIFHDLRSPIFSARGCADMMGPQEGENAECLSVIKEKLDFLSNLSEQLFLMAKLEDGKITFAQNQVPLHTLCRQLAEGAALEAERSGIRFSFQECGPLWVEGDGFRLKQALENMLQNAFQFTASGGSIDFELQRENGWVELRVRDSGKGIAPEDIPHVFERYYQGKNSDKQRSTGLGLAITRQIVLAHRGDISVESDLDKGTCFVIKLPLSEETI